MKPLRIYYAGAFGRAAAKVVAATVSHICDLGPADSEEFLPQGLIEEAPFAIFLSSPNLFALEDIAHFASGAPWICAFPFERHVVVTPVFAQGNPCVHCFARRWLCQPPAGYHGEVVHAISVFCRDHSIREYQNLSPLAAQLAANLLVKNAIEDSPAAVCYDTASLQLLSAQIRPLHGCSCRANSSRGTARFATFPESIQSLLSPMRTAPDGTEYSAR